MAVQTNNLLLLDLTPGSATRGSPKTIASTDEIVLNPQSFDLSSSNALNLATGGSVADIQAPTVRIGTEATGDYANVSTQIGSANSSIYLEGTSATFQAGTTVGGEVENGSGSTLSAGQLIAMKSSGVPAVGGALPYVTLASAASGGPQQVGGVVIETIANGSTGRVASVQGTVVQVTFESALVSPSRGALVYLSDSTPGTATLTPPSAGGSRVLIIGSLVSTTAASGSNYYVQLNPQVVADIPA
jgi:hypothetical protein